MDKSFVAPAIEFEELWALGTSAELSAYKATSSGDDDMANPEFVTISVGVRGKADFHLKIPAEEHSKSAEELLSRLRKYLREQS